MAPDRLRFDFTSVAGVSDDKLIDVAAIVNREIARNVAVTTEVKPYQDAVEEGAMALFGEKYGDTVRVVEIRDSLRNCAEGLTSTPRGISGRSSSSRKEVSPRACVALKP